MQANQAISNIIPVDFQAYSTRPTDIALLHSVARGDVRAMQTLYGRYWLSIYRFSRSITGNPSAADDIINVVFLKAWRCANEFNARSQVSTWLFASARNLAYAALRQRRIESLMPSSEPQIEDAADDSMVALIRPARRAALARCLKQLSTQHREIIDLVYYHEKSINEVSEIIGIPNAAVISRMHNARMEIAELMAQYSLR